MTNRLSGATSPYLLQHQHNPVDWWPWCDEAFDEARRRDVPIFLSIGYAACHWCHVMAHESFENESTAAMLNADFVNIKVDREERPDVDAVYMTAVQGLSGQGGWPMTVFLDHRRRPFHGGTYYPLQARMGMPSFGQLLAAIHDTWITRRLEVEDAAAKIVEALSTQARSQSGAGVAESLDEVELRRTCDEAVDRLARGYDHLGGGFGDAPKFPPTSVLEFLLRHHARTQDPRALTMVEGTCQAMAGGGFYDQLAGGFSRYSVDANWVVPHFEKMLYDNALLLRVYTHLYRATGSQLAKRVVTETAEFLLGDLRTAQGGFAASLDADAADVAGGHPVEGASYAWTPQQLRTVLGELDGGLATQLLAVSLEGTFERGASVLQLRQEPASADCLVGLANPGRWWAQVRARLRAARDRRPQPARDDKVVAAWNGLTIAALAEAGSLLNEPDWTLAATGAAQLLVDVHLFKNDNSWHLRRVSKDGAVDDRAGGVLEDYADVAEGFLTLAAVTGEQHWRELAGGLLESVLLRFGQPGGGFFDTPADGEALIMRLAEATDMATPAPASVAIGALLSYGTLMASDSHLRSAQEALASARYTADSPRFAGWWLACAEAVIDGPREVVIVGSETDARRAELHRLALESSTPGLVIAVGKPADGRRPESGPFADRREVEGQATAYVCRGSVCSAPVGSAAQLRALLS